jgi:hypothetical protein
MVEAVAADRVAPSRQGAQRRENASAAVAVQNQVAGSSAHSIARRSRYRVLESDVAIMGDLDVDGHEQRDSAAGSRRPGPTQVMWR